MENASCISVPGPFVSAASQLDLATILHSHEIMAERRSNIALHSQPLWAADGAVYRMEGGEPVLDLTLGEDNPLLRNVEAAVEQTLKQGHYVLTSQDMEFLYESIKAGRTLEVKLAGLRLQEDRKRFYVPFIGFHFPFGTTLEAIGQLTSDERKVVERAYGTGDELRGNMEMIREAGFNNTSILIYRPAAVVEKVPPGGAIAHACYAAPLPDAYFSANERNWDWKIGKHAFKSPHIFMRGKLKKAA